MNIYSNWGERGKKSQDKKQQQLFLLGTLSHNRRKYMMEKSKGQNDDTSNQNIQKNHQCNRHMPSTAFF